MEVLKSLIRKKLEEGADAFLCLVEEEGSPVPALITDPASPQLESLTPGDTRYPLTKLLIDLLRQYPERRFAVLVRGCDERALVELAKLEQVDLDRVELVGLACSEEEARACGCRLPYPSRVDLGERVEPAPDRGVVEEVASLPDAERLRFWEEHFSRCIKCYGCRNVCPMCFCEDCALENPQLVKPGVIPPEFPSFHIIRALDMAGRCVDCGLCEEACPAGVPLRALYRRMQEVMEERFGYRPGEDPDRRNPLSELEMGSGLEF
ncbi:MAG: 4Fe-4S ferredoxin [Actinobacteria bacterium]|nr:4Fe-4S ferredoxin [Actinomycetota bacterium]